MSFYKELLIFVGVVTDNLPSLIACFVNMLKAVPVLISALTMSKTQAFTLMAQANEDKHILRILSSKWSSTKVIFWRQISLKQQSKTVFEHMKALAKWKRRHKTIVKVLVEAKNSVISWNLHKKLWHLKSLFHFSPKVRVIENKRYIDRVRLNHQT